MAANTFGSLASGFTSGFMGGKSIQNQKELSDKLGKLLDSNTETPDKGSGETPPTSEVEPLVENQIVVEDNDEGYADGGMVEKNGYMHDMMYGSAMHRNMLEREEYGDDYMMPVDDSASMRLYDPYSDVVAHTGRTNDFSKK